MEFLKADYTEVWVPSSVAPLVRFADYARSLASLGLDLLGLPELDAPEPLLERLRSFDSIVSWYGANREEFRAATRRLGLPFQFHDALPPAESGAHAADFFLTQVGGTSPAIPRIRCPGATRGDFAVIHPFSGSPRKNWPLERFRKLAARLPMPVRWCAGPEESLEGAVHFDDLYDLACWLTSARLYVGNDSGITHLAAAVGVPVLAIFGPTDPAVWGPRGENVRVAVWHE